MDKQQNNSEKELQEIIKQSKVNIDKSLSTSTLLFLKHLSEIFESEEI